MTAAGEVDRVEEAFAATPREGFLPPGMRIHAGIDAPVEIGHGQTNSQPRTVAAMLRLLDVGPGQRVLDVGAGSGWTTALLAHLVGPGGQVVGVELVPELVEFGAANLAACDRPWACLEQADPDRLGAADRAPYDRILVSAEAESIPEELIAQLATDGVLVVPVRGTMLRIVRSGDALEVTEHGLYRFVPLL